MCRAAGRHQIGAMGDQDALSASAERRYEAALDSRLQVDGWLIEDDNAAAFTCEQGSQQECFLDSGSREGDGQFVVAVDGGDVDEHGTGNRWVRGYLHTKGAPGQISEQLLGLCIALAQRERAVLAPVQLAGDRTAVAQVEGMLEGLVGE